jgi:hypothetical protein
VTRLWWASVVLVAGSLLGGCAHPISVSGDAAALAGTSAAAAKVDRKVGLLITEEQRKREVTSPGGGGDKVSYFPYRDLETGLYVALNEVFTGVTRLAGPADEKVRSEGVTLIIAPEIITTSHSPSLLTWPPTVFTIELTCSVKDTDARELTRIRVQGEGRAEFDEFKSDPSLSAKRASTDALKKLVKSFSDAKPVLR